MEEVDSAGQDYVDIAVKSFETSGQKICSGPLKHVNENVRANRKYCQICKATLLDTDEENDEHDIIGHKRLRLDVPNDNNEPVKVDLIDIKDKSSLYENYSEEEPIMEAAGAVLVNSNTFSGF